MRLEHVMRARDGIADRDRAFGLLRAARRWLLAAVEPRPAGDRVGIDDRWHAAHDLVPVARLVGNVARDEQLALAMLAVRTRTLARQRADIGLDDRVRAVWRRRCS